MVPLPHIRQVLLPQAGSRIIICSDGVWDLMSLSKAFKTCRFKTTTAATAALMAAVSRDLRLLDDASIIVVDLLPSDSTSFPTVALKANPKPEKSGGLFACFKPELEEPDSRDLHTAAPGHLAFMADLDSLRVYPQLRAMLQRSQIQHLATALNNAAGGKPGVDYTMHGANKVSLYRGFVDSGGGGGGGGGSMGRLHSFSSPMGGEYPADANHSNHSVRSCEGPLQMTKSTGGLYGDKGGDFDHSPVVAFGSASERQGSGVLA